MAKVNNLQFRYIILCLYISGYYNLTAVLFIIAEIEEILKKKKERSLR